MKGAPPKNKEVALYSVLFFLLLLFVSSRWFLFLSGSAASCLLGGKKGEYMETSFEDEMRRCLDRKSVLFRVRKKNYVLEKD